MIKYVVIFWAIIGITVFILSKPHNIFFALIAVVMITGMGTGFTKIIIEDIIMPFYNIRKSQKKKNKKKKNHDNDEIYLKKMPLSILKIAGIILLITGMSSFINGAFAASGMTPWITEKTEIPLTMVGDYTMDKEGRLYCSLNFYCRIQQYDSSGNFLRGWFINSGGGRICMNTDDKGQLLIANIKFHNLLTFDSEGKMIKEEKLEGNEYEKWHRKDEKSETLLKMLESKIPLYIWFLFGPQCWLIAITGIAILIFSDKKLEKIK
jgi:hypothetical protein